MYSRRLLLAAGLGLAAGSVGWNWPAGTSATTNRVQPVDPVLVDYLSMSPVSIASLDRAIPFTFGNAQLQMETLGLALPFDRSDDAALAAWVSAIYSVALPQPIRVNALRDDLRDLLGFEIGQVFSGAECGEPPEMATFLRGDFDVEAVRATQQALGYQQTEIDGQLVMTLGPDGEMDLENPVQRMAMSRLNNASFLADGTLVYTATLSLMREVWDRAATLDGQPLVQQALEGLDGPLISAVLLGPGALIPEVPFGLEPPRSNDQIADVMLTMQAREEAPLVIAGIAGITPGGPLQGDSAATPSAPKSVGKFSLVYASASDAATAAGQIDARLASGESQATGQPWRDMLVSWSAVARPESTTVLLTLEWPEIPRPFDLVFRRDIAFISG